MNPPTRIPQAGTFYLADIGNNPSDALVDNPMRWAHTLSRLDRKALWNRQRMARPSKTSLKQQRHGLLLNLSELSQACPVHRLNPEDCPLFPLRQLKPSQRKHWLESLSEEDLRYLASYHHVCLKLKMESPAAANGRAGS